MTEKETVKILALLSAFYGNGKSNAQQMAKAWHMILQEYNYTLAERAVINYAREDEREYSSFPPPGQIVKQIKKELGKYYGVINASLNGNKYNTLTNEAKEVVSEDEYKKLLYLTEDEIRDNTKTLVKQMIYKIPLLKEGEENE